MDYAAVCDKRLSYSEGRWLLLAVVLHLLLLLFPAAKDRPERTIEPAKLTIQLVSIAAPTQRKPPLQAVAQEAGTQPLPPPATAPPDPPVDETPSKAGLPALPARSEPLPSAVRLIGMRETVTDRVPLPDRSPRSTLKLGSAGAFEHPGNWRPGAGAEALARFEDWFEGMSAPAQLETTDRWLAADGSHHVIVETPAGLRLCGRTQAWDPARPLLEPIMMWQVCGGDFARPLKYRPREPLDRDFIVPVAKETIEP